MNRSLLERYFRGDMTDKERGIVADWVRADEANLNEYMAVRRMYDALLVSEDKAAVPAHESSGCRVRRWGYTGRIAAALAGVLLLTGIEYFVLQKVNAPELIQKTCYVTSERSKGEFVLPDGSRVWLNCGSRLEFTDDFMDSDERNVTLYGEAVFDVSHDGRKFKVEAGNMAITVLGTHFGVRYDKKHSQSQVTLLTGKVQVDIPALEPIILEPSQHLSIDNVSGNTCVRKVDPNLYTCWTDDYVSFDNTPLKDILECLQHWYNVTISVSDGIDLNMRISFSMSPEPIEDTFRVLSTLIGHPHQIIDDTKVLIYEKD